MPEPRFAGLDAGGTSWKLVIAEGPDRILARGRIPTTNPTETLEAVGDWLALQRDEGLAFQAIGIASFGPVVRDPASKTFGQILTTPKPGWKGANAVQHLAGRFNLPVALDTDVNAALRAEAEWGAAKGLQDAVYLTIGGGVGGGVLSGGKLSGAPHHPEIGHMRLARTPENIAAFPGACPFHGDCVEGLISAPAIKKAWGNEPEELPDGHAAFGMIAETLGRLVMALTLAYAPQRILLGGGIMSRPGLLESVRHKFQEEMGDYPCREGTQDLLTYLRKPALGADAGALGGVWLARNAHTFSAP